MRATHSVVSGSVALAFVMGANWELKDLDIYTPRGEGCQAMLAHLIGKEGYTLQPQAAPETFDYLDDTAFSKILAVHKLSKIVQVIGEDKHRTLSIDVIEAASPNAVIPIFRFHSTVVMNWITADSIFVTYPKLTFHHKGLINQKQGLESPVRENEWKDKYLKRGFMLRANPAAFGDGGSCGDGCPLVLRSTFDVACLEFVFGEKDPLPADEVQWSTYRGVVPRTSILRCNNPSCSRCFSPMRRRNGTQGEFNRAAVGWMLTYV